MTYPRSIPRPFLLVLSGPSGAGKSTIIRALLAKDQSFVPSISVTTRDPRGTEQHGVDYFFADDTEFDQLIADDALLEYAEVFGTHRYGTPRSFIEEQFASGKNVIMDIDVQGALQIHQRLPERSMLVFLCPPDQTVLEARLRGRGTDSDEAIQRRLATAEHELAAWQQYDYLVFNHEVEQALADVQHLIGAQRLRIDQTDH